MTKPRDVLDRAIRAALKAGERERLATLRMLLNEVDNTRIREQAEVDDEGLVRLVRRGIKQREESVEQYEKGGREELAAKERREIEILREFLPPEVDEDELRRAISEILESSGATGPAAIGPVMREMMSRYGGRADGAHINRLVRKQLAGD